MSNAGLKDLIASKLAPTESIVADPSGSWLNANTLSWISILLFRALRVDALPTPFTLRARFP
ncbi:hypothetical protein [Pseudomonas sp. FEN]|uniref:hypothetical protein n=1 Tax=Pseudomonas sp. FEN TaxID=2767468 RepID=UPI001748E3E0|nr:hypothetical protein [Pseudomonas sp. FEN]